MTFSADIVVAGGCGHIGLPLGLLLASRDLRVLAYDMNADAVDLVNDGMMPFTEPGAEKLLRIARGGGSFKATTAPDAVSSAKHVIIATGIADEHLGERPAVISVVNSLREYLADGQLLILRSTVPPGVTAEVAKIIAGTGKDVDVAYCPERIAEGHALRELQDLPQIVAGVTEEAAARAALLFARIAPDIVMMMPEEAELAKLFTNTWRYVTFGIANQMWQAANDLGLDYERIRQGLRQNYPRASNLPAAGLAGGPCLPKDTALLIKACPGMTMARDAILVNQDLPRYITLRLAHRYPLQDMIVGILGMAFKGGSDDMRGSMVHQLRWLLEVRAREVLCTDPYVQDDSVVPAEDVLARADLLVIAAPHEEYRNLKPAQPVADIWDILGRGTSI